MNLTNLICEPGASEEHNNDLLPILWTADNGQFESNFDLKWIKLYEILESIELAKNNSTAITLSVGTFNSLDDVDPKIENWSKNCNAASRGDSGGNKKLWGSCEALLARLRESREPKKAAGQKRDVAWTRLDLGDKTEDKSCQGQKRTKG